MSAREELAGIIHQCYCLEMVHGEGCEFWTEDNDAADAILASGYRKPEQVTTIAELDALPNESIILDATGKCREGLTSIEGRNWWRAMGPSKVLPSADITLPATVLHVPEVAA